MIPIAQYYGNGIIKMSNNQFIKGIIGQEVNIGDSLYIGRNGKFYRIFNIRSGTWFYKTETIFDKIETIFDKIKSFAKHFT